jgi:hypothetical protein
MKTIATKNGYAAMVDDADYEALNAFQWVGRKIRNVVYAQRKVGGTYALMHRQILKAPSGVMVDHVNGIGLDNRRENLRLVSNSQNQQNRTKVKAAASRFKGVRFNKRKGKWYAMIRKDGKPKFLGHFDNEDLAARAYNAAAKQLFGPYAKTNSITEAKPGEAKAEPEQSPLTPEDLAPLFKTYDASRGVPPVSQAPEGGWRLLTEGELILDTDEYLEYDGKRWASMDGSLLVGSTFGLIQCQPIRRRAPEITGEKGADRG